MMARKLPSDLEEEILVRVPPLSLVRFRSVCKEWNNLFKNKRFVNKSFACSRPEFMLKTHSKIYSISVNLSDDPTIKVRDLCVDFLRGNHRFYHHGTCDGYFFMYDFYKGGVVWNPLLRQIKWVAEARKACGKSMGYDGNRPEKSYKIIGIWSVNRTLKVEVVSEFATKAWKVTDHHTSYLEMSKMANDSYSRVSLNGNLYWPARNRDTGEYFIGMLDYSKEIRKPFCILPCKAKKKFTHSRVLSLYKGDRFSVLEQCVRTREVEIWVTKKKIGNGDDVVWIKFMTISIPNFPIVNHTSSSYFVDDNIHGKSCVVCCRSKKPAQAWVYIVRGDMCKKIKIDGVVTSKFQSSVYVPSLITIP